MDLSETIHLLGNALGAVISELESPALFEKEEEIRNLAKARRGGDRNSATRLRQAVAELDPDAARAVAAAFALYFDLVNLAEEEHRVWTLRQRERDQYPEPIAQSIGAAVAEMKRSGVTEDQLARILHDLHIELVLTAHPTEAKRRSILSKLSRIHALIRVLDVSDLNSEERNEALTALQSEIMTVWLTARARTVRLTVTDEVRTGLFFVDEVFWDVLPRIYAALDAALSDYYPGLATDHPWLTLASWMGGDRDGNPFVTAAVTAETLRLHRGLAVERPQRALQELSRRLSLSGQRLPPSPELQAWLAARRPYPPHAAYISERYPDEPYRLVLALLGTELAEASQDDMTARLLSAEPHTARAATSDFTIPLEMVAASLPPTIAQGPLLTLRRQFEIFGLHGARLDLREHAARLRSTLSEILRALGMHPAFDQADGPTRRQILTDLLSQPRPELAQQAGVTPQTAETWALFRLIARARAVYGSELLGPFIISMTQDAADVLTVLLLARWTKADHGLQIVPLVETVEDLQSAPTILRDLFSLDVYRAHLSRLGNHQMMMVGYSDSNKDGGYLAANWALYHAQENIAAVCREFGITWTLFHGRGGTVARGGGPANRAIQAQPPGTVAGRFRLTEQGEVIAARYGNPDLARRHLEQIVSAVLLASSPARTDDPVPEAWRQAMSSMAGSARSKYRSLVYDTSGFLDFWQAVTPLDEIVRLHIGSRPAARGAQLEVEHIRAIPWVFSWMQSRFNLPGWYGLGSGLTAGVDVSQLRDMYKGWPFLRALLDNAEMSLLKADMDVAALYAELVPDQDLARRILSTIRDEYDRTRSAILEITGHHDLLETDPVIQRSVHLRNPYVDPLNYLQIELLRRLRGLRDQESSEAQALRQAIIITINGIASGLRNTG